MKATLTTELIGNWLVKDFRLHPAWLTNGHYLAKRRWFVAGEEITEDILHYMFPAMQIGHVTDEQIAKVLASLPPHRVVAYERTRWRYTAASPERITMVLFRSSYGDRWHLVNAAYADGFQVETLWGAMEVNPLRRGWEALTDMPDGEPSLVIATMNPREIHQPPRLFEEMPT